MVHYLKREITQKECPWLPNNLKAGSQVYPVEDKFEVCSENGVAVMLFKNKLPYFEIPKDSVTEQYWAEFSLN
jgi:hypothetical protein